MHKENSLIEHCKTFERLCAEFEVPYEEIRGGARKRKFVRKILTWLEFFNIEQIYLYKHLYGDVYVTFYLSRGCENAVLFNSRWMQFWDYYKEITDDLIEELVLAFDFWGHFPFLRLWAQMDLDNSSSHAGGFYFVRHYKNLWDSRPSAFKAFKLWYEIYEFTFRRGERLCVDKNRWRKILNEAERVFIHATR